MFKSLKYQLLFYLFIANVIVLTGFGTFIYHIAQKGVLDKQDAQLKILSQDAIADLIPLKYVNAKEISEVLSKEFNFKELKIKIIYINKKTKKIDFETISNKNDNKLFDIPFNTDVPLQTIEYFNNLDYRVSSMHLLKDINKKIFFQIAVEKNINTPYLSKLRNDLLVSIPLLLVILLIIVNLILNKTLGSVKKVIKSVNLISKDNLSNRIDNKNIPLEIKELIDTFNKLLTNIEDTFSRVSTFSSDASHEIKTPLAIMRGEIEVTLRKERTSSEYKTALEDILEETIIMQTIIEQLFLLTKQSSAELRVNIEEIYLDELISNIVTEYKKHALNKSININIIELIPISINVNESLLKIAIGNIIRNAILYSKENSDIEIKLYKKNSSYILEIKDFGCGISKENLPYIYDRFYRVDKARSRKNSGTGLGLSIAKMIFDIYTNKINIISTIDIGTTVNIELTDEK